jgi:hypothetical protein
MKNRTKYLGAPFALLVVVLLAGVTVSATVQYQTVRPLTIDEAKAQIEAYMNNPSYQKLKAQGVPYFESHYNATVKQHLNETITAYLLDKVLPSGYEPLCPLLAEICYEAMCLMIVLFGHGLIGVGMASIAFWTINLCGSIFAGAWVGLVLIGGGLFWGSLLGELLIAILAGGTIYQYGLIGFLIAFICALPVLLLIAVLAIPIAYVLGVFLVMMDNLDYCLSQPVP